MSVLCDAARPGPGHETSEATGTEESLAEFEGLLRLLRQKHARLCRENAALRGWGAPSQEKTRADGAADAAGGVQQSTGGASGRAPSPVMPPAGSPLALGASVQERAASCSPRSEAAVSEGGPSARVPTSELASDRLSRDARYRSQRLGGSRELVEHFGTDTGGSQANKKIATELMQKHLARRNPNMKYFGFTGAKRLKEKMKWVRNNNFDYTMAMIIVLNAVYMGAQTWVVTNSTRYDRNSAEKDRRGWLVGDMIFAAIFTIELTVRVFAYQVNFYRGSQKWWNFFDCVTIVATVVATLLDMFGTAPGFYINFFKVLRLARLVRSLKVSKSRFFHNLKVLSYTVAGSANAFMSAITLLFVVMYVFGIMFMQGLQSYILSDNADPQVMLKLEDYFGSPPDTIFTLLNSITGGINWHEVAFTLHGVEPSYKWFFVAYITFTVLCVLNILNGVFVTVAIESAQTNKELAIENTQLKTRALIEQMVEWFIQADKDMSNKVSFSELHGLMRDDKVRVFLRANGIDIASAAQRHGGGFLLLDRDGTGQLEPEEFVDNLIMLQGNAKAIGFSDLASLRVVCDDMSQRVADMEVMIRDHFDGPDSPPVRRRTTQVPGGLGRGTPRGWDLSEDALAWSCQSSSKSIRSWNFFSSTQSPI
ncbi:unnamed protein product [Prorocentrum cordatum]|uniref:EF-hand domain-containing protein n=1 Tax=Prorocentrum cordatum TaxID=2364126 RepID=A0ABN9VSW7_9DINO|nr:unnamed protein product [Polarella glacialis]